MVQTHNLTKSSNPEIEANNGKKERILHGIIYSVISQELPETSWQEFTAFTSVHYSETESASLFLSPTINHRTWPIFQKQMPRSFPRETN